MRTERKLTIELAICLAVGAVMLAATATSVAQPPKPVHGPAILAGPVKISLNCTEGAFSEYCGAQQNPTDKLGFYYGGWSEWVAIAFAGRGEYEANYKFFDWAPRGVPQHLCITDSGSKLVLSACTGAKDQLFHAETALLGFTWQNVETGLYIQDNGRNKALTAVPADGESNQEWNFFTG